MAVMQQVSRATTRKGKKILLRKEPKIIEGPKKCLFLHGRKTSIKVRKLTKDLHCIKKPHSVILSKKNDITIFEDSTTVESFCRKYETSLFVVTSHSKKRPDNLVLGRMYNHSLLDMAEFHVENYNGLFEFANSKLTLGTKPCLVFNGSMWEESPEFQHIKSLLIDMFHKENVDCIRLQGLEHVMSFTAALDQKIFIKSYKIKMKNSNTNIPKIELEEIGPNVELKLRRSKLPSDDLMAETLKVPKPVKVKKKKNIRTDNLGTTTGRIHIGKQRIDKMQTRKIKGLRKPLTEKKNI